MFRVTDHWNRIARLMRHWSQRVPAEPTFPTPQERELRVRLIFTEVLEYAKAAGVGIRVEIPDDEHLGFWLTESHVLRFSADPVSESEYGDRMVAMIDGLADISVTTVGGFVGLGVQDIPVLEEVDANNALKVHPEFRGDVNPVTGKFEKNKNHPKPDFTRVLRDMGWKGAEVPCSK